jgi:hypothetical protein
MLYSKRIFSTYVLVMWGALVECNYCFQKSFRDCAVGFVNRDARSCERRCKNIGQGRQSLAGIHGGRELATLLVGIADKRRAIQATVSADGHRSRGEVSVHCAAAKFVKETEVQLDPVRLSWKTVPHPLAYEKNKL